MISTEGFSHPHLVHRPPYRHDFLFKALLQAQIRRVDADRSRRNRHPRAGGSLTATMSGSVTAR